MRLDPKQVAEAIVIIGIIMGFGVLFGWISMISGRM